MKLGPHPDNLKGGLALEQLHFVKDVTWPGVQHDTELHPLVSAQAGYRWPSGLSITLGGGMDPFSTSHWNAAVLVGGSL